MRTWTERRSRPGRRPLPQNEPNSAQWYPACTWTPEGLAQFVAYLGPEMRKRGVEVWLGTIERADSEMWDRMDVPQDSEGARLIIEEARKCSPERPLFVCMGGPLTDVSSALLLAPDIAPNMIVIWIGGQEYPFGHPQPWGGISEVEYNLNLDIPAARCLFNDSAVRLWQVPRDVYRQCLYSFASMERHIRPLGALGAYLMESLERWRRFSSGAVYCLGDSPLVLLSSLQTFFEPDTASSDFVQTPAPYITEDGRYDFSRAGRAVRVYTRIDTYLMFKDMEDRLAVQ